MNQQTADKIINFMVKAMKLLDYLPTEFYEIRDYINALVSEDECDKLPDKSLACTVLSLCECDICEKYRTEIALREADKFIAEFPANKNLTVKFYSAYLTELTQEED